MVAQSNNASGLVSYTSRVHFQVTPRIPEPSYIIKWMQPASNNNKPSVSFCHDPRGQTERSRMLYRPLRFLYTQGVMRTFPGSNFHPPPCNILKNLLMVRNADREWGDAAGMLWELDMCWFFPLKQKRVTDSTKQKNKCNGLHHARNVRVPWVRRQKAVIVERSWFELCEVGVTI